MYEQPVSEGNPQLYSGALTVSTNAPSITYDNPTDSRAPPALYDQGDGDQLYPVASGNTSNTSLPVTETRLQFDASTTGSSASFAANKQLYENSQGSNAPTATTTSSLNMGGSYYAYSNGQTAAPSSNLGGSNLYHSATGTPQDPQYNLASSGSHYVAPSIAASLAQMAEQPSLYDNRTSVISVDSVEVSVPPQDNGYMHYENATMTPPTSRQKPVAESVETSENVMMRRHVAPVREAQVTALNIEQHHMYDVPEGAEVGPDHHYDMPEGAAAGYHHYDRPESREGGNNYEPLAAPRRSPRPLTLTLDDLDAKRESRVSFS